MSELFAELAKIPAIVPPSLPKSLESIGVLGYSQISELAKTMTTSQFLDKFVQLHSGFRDLNAVTGSGAKRKSILVKPFEDDLARLELAQVTEDFLFI